MSDIFSSFPISTQEYLDLDKKFGSLTHFISWQLIKRNNRNNHTEEQEDIAQELKISLIRAGSYYKRQVYIEDCLRLCRMYAKDKLLCAVMKQLQSLWENKIHHGAGRQKFGPYQEWLLDRLVKKLVPKKERPLKTKPLKIDSKFSTYCKSITWNQQKALGKRITREKAFRATQVSLSEHDFLGADYACV